VAAGLIEGQGGAGGVCALSPPKWRVTGGHERRRTRRRNQDEADCIVPGHGLLEVKHGEAGEDDLGFPIKYCDKRAGKVGRGSVCQTGGLVRQTLSWWVCLDLSSQEYPGGLAFEPIAQSDPSTGGQLQRYLRYGRTFWPNLQLLPIRLSSCLRPSENALGRLSCRDQLPHRCRYDTQ
jgi:hypothetical protein